jgi:hypothetical protein
MVSGTWPVTPRTWPSHQVRRKGVPGQSWSGSRTFNNPDNIWVKRVPTAPLPEPRLQGDNRSKLFGSHLIGPERSDITADGLGIPLARQLSRKSLADLFLFPGTDENAENP